MRTAEFLNYHSSQHGLRVNKANVSIMFDLIVGKEIKCQKCVLITGRRII